MNDESNRRRLSRRDFFSRVGDGLHGAALASLLAADLYPGGRALAAKADPSASATIR